VGVEWLVAIVATYYELYATDNIHSLTVIACIARKTNQDLKQGFASSTATKWKYADTTGFSMNNSGLYLVQN